MLKPLTGWKATVAATVLMFLAVAFASTPAVESSAENRRKGVETHNLAPPCNS